MIFFREVDDPNDLFEELVWENESESSESSETGNGIDNNVQYTSNTSSDSRTTASSPLFIPTLKDCFNLLCSMETLDWKCEKCCQNVQAQKQLQLWRLPDILILHLKRFSYGTAGPSAYTSYHSAYSGSGGAKINRAVDFSLEIDLKDVLPESSPDQSTKYELFAISQNFGSLHYGHYTAILKHQSTSKWFLADDGTIKVFGNGTEEGDWFNERVREAAYVLFYRRIK